MNAQGRAAPAIEVIQLRRVYRLAGGREVRALQGIDLRVEAGSFIALKGRSGSGKTTLLNCVGGLDRPSSGQVRVFDQDLATLDEAGLAVFRRREVSFVFQSFGLLPGLSAYENVELALRIAGSPARQRHERTLECLKLVGIEKWKNHQPSELSGGQQQRVAIARALANRPRLILADEPTGDLDTASARDILTLFRSLVAGEGITLLMASHDPMVAAYVDRTLFLEDGAIRG